MNFPAIARATISASVGRRNRHHRGRSHRDDRRRDTAALADIPHYLDKVISSLWRRLHIIFPRLATGDKNPIIHLVAGAACKMRRPTARDEAPLR
jgi:hypothetical protein